MSRKLKDLFTKEYVCTNCKTGKIEVTCQLFDDGVQLSAKNCDNCGYQYTIPQVYEAMKTPGVIQAG
jgi:transcription elongation factor Elf1